MSDKVNRNSTESPSNHQHLDKMTTSELISAINREDQSVAQAVGKSISQITRLVDAAYEKIKDGGRLFYIGAGTSGRLGILDASEIPPTFGMPHDRVIGLIAGGDGAIRKAVEFAEDDTGQAWKDLEKYNINTADFLIGIAASGKTPYVIGGIEEAGRNNIATGCIVCNADSKLAEVSEYPVEVVVGPEFVTGSTRMKAGTAQKMVLNMISTSLMIRIGRVSGNRMTYMQLSNNKLVERGIKMIVDALGVDEAEAKELLERHGSVNSVLSNY